jgi:hypothetical protein
MQPGKRKKHGKFRENQPRPSVFLKKSGLFGNTPALVSGFVRAKRLETHGRVGRRNVFVKLTQGAV